MLVADGSTIVAMPMPNHSPLLAGDGLLLAQPVVVDVLEGQLEGAVVVTAVVDAPAGRGVGELRRR